jgi:hypothetical protein
MIPCEAELQLEAATLVSRGDRRLTRAIAPDQARWRSHRPAVPRHRDRTGDRLFRYLVS